MPGLYIHTWAVYVEVYNYKKGEKEDEEGIGNTGERWTGEGGGGGRGDIRGYKSREQLKRRNKTKDEELAVKEIEIRGG